MDALASTRPTCLRRFTRHDWTTPGCQMNARKSVNREHATVVGVLLSSHPTRAGSTVNIRHAP